MATKANLSKQAGALVDGVEALITDAQALLNLLGSKGEIHTAAGMVLMISLDDVRVLHTAISKDVDNVRAEIEAVELE